MKNFLLGVILCFLGIWNGASSQDTLLVDKIHRTQYYTELGTFLTTSSKMPFWLRTNQYGIVPDKGPFITTLRGGVSYDYNKLHPKKYDWGYGADVAVNAGFANKIYLPEAYIKVKLNKFEFYAGRRREIFGLVDTTLTSGSYSWSGNALPIPKLQISIPDYLPIGLTKGVLAVKGSFAHGWFDNKGLVKDFYLHQKSFYTRLGKPTWKMKLYTGFTHNVQWGGTPFFSSPGGAIAGESYPTGLKNYWYAISGFSLNNLTPEEQLKYQGNDAYNRVGNHLGSIDLGLSINLDKVDILLYRQTLYETGSLFYLSSIADGLQGLSFKNKNIQKKKLFIKEALLEYLYTKNQGGVFGSNTDISPLRGRVNYFSNSQYLNGWTYSSNIIGTPFITFNENFISLKNEAIYNNRVSVVYLGFKGNIDKTPFEARFSYAKNWGTYNIPMNKSQFSSLVKIQWVLPKLVNKSYYLTTTLSTDFGNLYPTNMGCYLGLRRFFF